MFTIETSAASVAINPLGGHLDEVEFRVGGATLRPMHRAHWRTGEANGGVPEAFGDEVPQILKSLAGDFFCAPFALDDLTGGPEHGPPANGTWHEVEAQEDGPDRHVRLKLEATLLGAEVHKTVSLREGHPVVYQRHAFVGGHGATSVAHHPMVRTDGGVRLCVSPKQFGATADPIETDPARGRCALLYPQEFRDLSRVALAGGGTVDLRHLPGPEGYEDFLLLAEDAGSALGWSVVLAEAQGFLFFVLRDPKVLPVTLLWLSNGGRSYPPFLGRHRNVIGIEEARTFFNAGHAASTHENWLTRRGIPTALTLAPDGEVEVRLAFGAIPHPAGWTEVTDVALLDGQVRFTDVSGAVAWCPFDAGLAGLAP